MKFHIQINRFSCYIVAVLTILLTLLLTINAARYITIKTNINSISNFKKNTNIEQQFANNQVIFFKDSCPKCKNMIPKVFITKQLLLQNRHTIYVDLDNINNKETIVSKYHLKQVPTSIYCQGLKKFKPIPLISKQNLLGLATMLVIEMLLIILNFELIVREKNVQKNYKLNQTNV